MPSSPGFLDFQPRDRLDTPLYSITLTDLLDTGEGEEGREFGKSVVRPAFILCIFAPARASPTSRPNCQAGLDLVVRSAGTWRGGVEIVWKLMTRIRGVSSDDGG